MSQKSVLLTEPIQAAGIEILEREVTVKLASDTSLGVLCEEVRGMEGLIIRVARIPREVIEAGCQLEVIGRHGSGLDNVCLEAARERDIAVINTPEANTESVAEHVIGFMIALAKGMLPADRALRQGNPQFGREHLGVELAGKTLGIVGVGRIGSRVARMAEAAFGMSVLGYDPYVDNRRANKLGMGLAKFDELLARADFVSLHVPLTEATAGLIGSRELKLMKQSAFLINAARGGVVDEEALLVALRAGEIAGAALDVFEEGLPSADNPILSLDNVLVTPHMAALTKEARIRMAIGVAEDVLRVLRGEEPRHRVV